MHSDKKKILKLTNGAPLHVKTQAEWLKFMASFIKLKQNGIFLHGHVVTCLGERSRTFPVTLSSYQEGNSYKEKNCNYSK